MVVSIIGAIIGALIAVFGLYYLVKEWKDPEPFDSAACSFIEEAKEIAGEMERSKQKELTRPIVEKILEAIYIYDDNHMELKFHFGYAVKDIMERVGAE